MTGTSVKWLDGSPRVIVCGGRDYDHPDVVGSVLDEYIGQAERGVSTDRWPVLVHGDAAGADTLADNWAGGKNVLVEPHPADWAVHGRAAGPIRNQEMLEAGADLVIAFPGGKGTADMVKRAKAAGVEVIEPCALCDVPVRNYWPELPPLHLGCWARRGGTLERLAHTTRGV